MATIGQALTSPEAGWQRFDNADSNITYIGAWTASGNASAYLSTYKWTTDLTAKIGFNFIGTKLRYIGYSNTTTYTTNAVVKIDNVQVGTFTQIGSTDSLYQTLNFEITDLSNKEHCVEISYTNGQFMIDAIDIDSTGQLKPYNFFVTLGINIRTQLSDMNIGDVIPCTYTATSGAVGTFSNLGSNSGAEIPFVSSATPNGLFYFIHAGYDTKGRMKLIADRNIQNTISWDVLNTKGIASGLPIWTSDTKYKYIIRLLTGGTSSTDTDNEWDKIIANSTLNGTITAGDNNIWNWNGQYSWTSTTGTSNTNRVIRGNTAVGTYLGTTTSSTTTATSTGFRPILLVERTYIYKYLIQQGSDIFSIKSAFYKVGSGSATADDFSNFGADDLTSITTIQTQNGILGGAFTTLGSGIVSSIPFNSDYGNINTVNIN